jgi:hypothetical protein
VEKAIAQRLKESNREERKDIYMTMYDELLRRAPDHPRLGERHDRESTMSAAIQKKNLDIIRNFPVLRLNRHGYSSELNSIWEVKYLTLQCINIDIHLT